MRSILCEAHARGGPTPRRVFRATCRGERDKKAEWRKGWRNLLPRPLHPPLKKGKINPAERMWGDYCKKEIKGTVPLEDPVSIPKPVNLSEG